MPDLFVLAHKDRAKILEPLLCEQGELAKLLRRATARAVYDLAGPQDVEVRLIVPKAENNTTRVQIICLLSRTAKRSAEWDGPEGIKVSWARKLAFAWREMSGVWAKFGKEFPLTELGIWPLMPEGEWFLASKLLER